MRLILVVLLAVLVAPGVAQADYRDLVLSDEPSGYWRFEEARGTIAANEVQGGAPGTYVGGPWLRTPGAFAGSAGMVGTSTSGANLGLFEGGGEFTVDAWTKQGTDGGYYDKVFARDGLWGVYHVGGATVVVCWSGAWAWGNGIRDGRWHHVAVVHRAPELQLYVDGELSSSTICPGVAGDVPLTAGNGGGSPWNPPPGIRTLDELALYDHALPQDRLRAHAGARTAADDDPGVSAPPSTGGAYSSAVLEDRPWGYWRLEDDPMRTPLAEDSSGGGHHAGIWSRGWSGSPGGVATTEQSNHALGPGVILDVPSMPAETTSQTLELWTKITVNPYIWSSGLFQTPYVHGYAGGRAFVFIPYNGYVPGTEVLHDRAWHHLVFAYDAPTQTLSVYVDGTRVLHMTGVAQKPMFSSGSRTIVGEVGSIGGVCVDEVALYDHALSGARVSAHRAAAGWWRANGRCGGTDDVPAGEAPAPPVNTSPPAVTGEREVGATLTCDPGDWDGADSLDVRWERDGVLVGTGTTYVLGEDDVEATLRCVVTASGAGGVSDPAASDAEVWLPRPPVPTGVRLVDAGDPDADGVLAVEWDAAGGVTWVVERSAPGGGWTQVGAAGTPRLDLADEPDGRWRYRVVAIAGGVRSPSGPTTEVLVDTTPPSLALTCPAGLLAVGETGAVAAVQASDDGSGLADPAPAELPVDASAPGDHTLTYAVTDRAGHRTEASCVYRVRFRAPGAPVLTAGTTPTATGVISLGWAPQTGDPDPAAYVLERRDADDPDWIAVASGPARTWDAPAAGLPEGTHRFRVRAVDPRFDDAASGELTVVVDRTAPRPPRLVPDRPAATADGWWADRVEVTPTSDGDPDLADGSPGSGVDAASLPAPTVFAAHGTHTSTATATDHAGNVSQTASGTFRVDTSVPVQWIGCPGTVTLDAAASATWFAFDTGSGLSGPSQGSVALDTSRVGTFTAVAPVARDRVGHEAGPATCTYRVVYDWSGFLAPFMDTRVNEIDAGDTVPVRFSLAGDRGLAVLDGAPELVALAQCGGRRNRVQETVPATSPDFSYDAANDRYTWVLRSDPSWARECMELVVRLDDGTEHRTTIRFR